MKKKILSGLFALALLATAGYGVNKSMKSEANLSDLALNNVEALANGEIEDYYGYQLKEYESGCKICEFCDWCDSWCNVHDQVPC